VSWTGYIRERVNKVGRIVKIGFMDLRDRRTEWSKKKKLILNEIDNGHVPREKYFCGIAKHRRGKWEKKTSRRRGGRRCHVQVLYEQKTFFGRVFYHSA